MNCDKDAEPILDANSEKGSPMGDSLSGLDIKPTQIFASGSNISSCDEEFLPPSYEFTLEQPRTSLLTDRVFRPPPLNQLTPEEANRALDSAEKLWNQQDWHQSRKHYTTAGAIFRVIEDLRNEAFCLQRLGEVCRILKDYPAARAHIYQAHLLFGRCGEVARQLTCERWLARVAADEGMAEEAQLLLESALESSRVAGLRESEGWCLLRLGEVENNRDLISQSLDIAGEERLSLLERRCLRALGILQDKKKEVDTAKVNPPVNEQNKAPTQSDGEASTSNRPHSSSNQPHSPSSQPQSRTGKVISRLFGKISS
ncbi:hypothetical protein BDV93DRAFT_606318 [Ceratobasidium sp. AG-I]|nr:hypothetical protein BDV93DRAFT_606318 [Ceratobasidium sp. AG-I]